MTPARMAVAMLPACNHRWHVLGVHDQEAACGNPHGGGNDQQPLVARAIGEPPCRRLPEHRCKVHRRHGETNLLGIPVPACAEVDGEVRTHPRSHVSNDGVQPFERAKASRAPARRAVEHVRKCCRALSRSSSVAARRSSPLGAVRLRHPGPRRGGSAAPAGASRPATQPSGRAEDSGPPRVIPFHHSPPQC